MAKKPTKTDPESLYIVLAEELQKEFPHRLRQAIGPRSVLSFARACGLSDSLVRKYLSGSLPGLGNALVMAREAGVSLEWLATGREWVAPRESSEADPKAYLTRMEEVIAFSRLQFQRRGIELPPESEAKVIRVIYEAYVRDGREMDGASLEDMGVGVDMDAEKTIPD
ncbi:transcriptional regulator with XRE-family HTH domain [Natronospira proteinivora]|uniref:Transcriptional regulator with XRE-family HTH domain n=1 Tax=Natronospira proteinivora TaxID=1807133 RepID=A0ABT1G4X8_9GAMM|nr:transcriptional regulator [Natronospira proteinivora]MCP1726349.1 transcriptional regulator with XRE-family HTH domain [Natronospira proteinivora]